MIKPRMIAVIQNHKEAVALSKRLGKTSGGKREDTNEPEPPVVFPDLMIRVAFCVKNCE